MRKRKESFFWTSYSDLMTSLFFIMLVLFVLVIVLLYKRMEVTQSQLDEIKRVVESTKDLDSTYFEYRDEYKKYVLKIAVEFPKGKSTLTDVGGDKLEPLYDAGKEIQRFLKEHRDHQYLLIVEGQASRDTYGYNYELSYQRALGLMRFWMQDRGLDFGGNCEIQISGSGDGVLNTRSMREQNETQNQRFLIHILPKNVIQNE